MKHLFFQTNRLIAAIGGLGSDSVARTANALRGLFRLQPATELPSGR